jgi:hypothetical protein
MPFTLAHPAAVLPLRGLRHLRSVPLMVGAMAPDTPYYFPGRLQHAMPETHRFEDSFGSCLLFGYLLLAALFVLRRPLTALLAPRARWLCLHALAPFSRPREWLWAAPALLLGIWTHLLWDSFTHSDGWMVHRVAALSAPVNIAGYSGPLCHLLQYLSSVVGLTILAWWYLRLPAPARPRPDPHATRTSSRPVLLLIAAAAGLIASVQAIEIHYRAASFYRTIDVFLTHGITWFAVLYLIAGTIVTLEHDQERGALHL